MAIFNVFGIENALFSKKSFDDFSWPVESRSGLIFPRFEKIPKCVVNGDKTKLLIIVKSAATNRESRDNIRKTWGKWKSLNDVQIATIFVIGLTEDHDFEEITDKEADTYRDILKINALDTYRNNTLKFSSSIEFAFDAHNCPSKFYHFLLLVDDDYLVHPINLIDLIKTKSPDDKIYEGFSFDTSPFRFLFHKHHISLKEYPYNRYPKYVSAGAVLLSRQTVEIFYHSIPKFKSFPFDDVYTGILAKANKIDVIHNPNFVFWSREIGRDQWNEGIVAAHGYNDNMVEQYKLLFQ
ncbi:unnamed protein product [Caenorhabditis bovis]|uniref:Hexosyltransferase n=1 Tax=Caenorhabditis bovis TaxID=2654633 RepID=A0A8S1FCC6_9PELO|nr:unnamed protein product [Caenorhabditis bovis]